MSCDSMAAEEERIQRIVRQIVSSEIGEANPNCTNVDLSSSRMALPNEGVNEGLGDVREPVHTYKVQDHVQSPVRQSTTKM